MFAKTLRAAVAAGAILIAPHAFAQSLPLAPLQAEYAKYDVSDDALIKDLPGFKSGAATVNGVRLNYVEGGAGELVVLLPGWPETWWSYHKIMPELAKSYRVVSVDVRGMGRSDKPADGYDKKTWPRILPS